MIESLLTIAGSVAIGIWMYKKGYKKGYRDGYFQGARDGYGFHVIPVETCEKLDFTNGKLL